ncbi:MAG TPA: PD-(D/E)XK nuclease family transposase, partial [Candidatus Cryptobacteroides intestinipullorum]|nr:PD-(D/E)XK nuclease family transposase [Candidatus Cryptobacteroides intestinipullorum]
ERFGKRLDECRTMTEKWLYALKHVGTLDRLPESLRMQAFERLFEACEIAKFEPERKLTYEENMITEQDYYNIIDTAREDGIIQGKAEGCIEVAKSLKGLGVPFETIVKATGLSESEIVAL